MIMAYRRAGQGPSLPLGTRASVGARSLPAADKSMDTGRWEGQWRREIDGRQRSKEQLLERCEHGHSRAVWRPAGGQFGERRV